MTAGHLTIRVGDQAYGLQTSSCEALAYFSRAYAACSGCSAEETRKFALRPCGRSWKACSDGADFARGSLPRVMRLLDWELTRCAVKQDSTCAAFHAAWVVRNRRIAILAGEGGSGKSRLCLQLLDRGFRCGAEDVTFIRDGCLVPFPKALQLRKDDPALRHVKSSRVFSGCDGRVCVEVVKKQAASPIEANSLTVAFLDPSASGEPSEPLAPLDGLERLFALCHRLDRVTQPIFETFSAAALAGRMFVVPRRGSVAAVLKILERGDD